MSYIDGHVKYETRPMRSHKQGRFITTTAGHLERPGGNRIDLHAFLTDHKPSVTLWPIQTNIMRNSGLFQGNYALVDKSRSPAPGKVVVVRYLGQVVIRRLMYKDRRWCLVADDPREQILYISEFSEVEHLGVVTHGIITL